MFPRLHVAIPRAIHSQPSDKKIEVVEMEGGGPSECDAYIVHSYVFLRPVVQSHRSAVGRTGYSAVCKPAWETRNPPLYRVAIN